MDAVQKIQSDEYGFPYHYLAHLDREGFSAYRDWGWSLSYVTALRRVLERLKALGTQSHIDIGCGDGALVKNLAEGMPGARLAGIDYDEQAIAFARAFNPELEFFTGDITKMTWPEPFETATLIEVIEHIQPDFLPQFLAACRSAIRDDGTLIVTVPHANKPLEAKHYRHFTFDSLKEALSGSFEVKEIWGFERRGKAKRAIARALNNPVFFAELKFVNRLLLNRELGFFKRDEEGCGRIMAICTPK